MHNGVNIFVRGAGAVSPAGSGVAALSSFLSQNAPLNPASSDVPYGFKPLKVFKVPPITLRPQILSHPRLRRSSRISQFAACAALESIGGSLPSNPLGGEWAVVVCMTAGCLDYSRRFFEEVLRDPATASPLLFPETVFNAPASHLATVLGISGAVDTLVGDETTFLDGVQLAQEWLYAGDARNVLVVATEEADWIASYAASCFSSRSILCEGAAALWLSLEPPSRSESKVPIVQAGQVTLDKAGEVGSVPKLSLGVGNGRGQLLSKIRRSFVRGGAGWRGFSSLKDLNGADGGDTILNLGEKLGEGLSLHGGWQCAIAMDWILKSQCDEVLVQAHGFNRQFLELLLFSSDSVTV